jgi:hypothetical protein
MDIVRSAKVVFNIEYRMLNKQINREENNVMWTLKKRLYKRNGYK